MDTMLPDFRNMGVVLRTLVLAQGVRLAWVGISGAGWTLTALQAQSVLYEPVLLSVLVLLASCAPLLSRLPYRLSVGLVVLLTAGLAAAWHLGMNLGLPSLIVDPVWKSVAVACLVAGFVLFYFNWRYYRLSPAWSEARLMALQARIQPHFLFNSLNSVLSLIRVNPPKAEAMLEDLCDLYRHLLADSRQLVPLRQELELARTYLQIETIRFGERLRVEWQCDDVPEHVLVPPLLLQPLLENAVRYGVEPAEQGATIVVYLACSDQQLDIRISNPVIHKSAQAIRILPSNGNHMALDNLRERLALHYDAEASLTTRSDAAIYEVRVRLPVRLP